MTILTVVFKESLPSGSEYACAKQKDRKGHQGTYYIFWSFGIIGLILIQFKNRIPVKPMLGDSAAPLHFAHEQTQ